MTNEWKEFQSYVTKPSYFCINKKDLSFLGRFSFKTLTEYEGLGRILTVIARGYLFHNTDGSLKDGKQTPALTVRHGLWLAFLFAWSMISLTGVSEYIYFSF